MPQYELNIRDYLRIFHKRKLTILLTFILVTSLSLFLTPKESVYYEAKATIKIEERKTIAGILTEEIVFNPADRMASETKLIKGYPIIKQVALKLGMITEKSTLDDIDSVVSDLQGRVDTERIGDTNMIDIKATADNGRDAMNLANAVAQLYIEDNLMEKAKQANHGKKFIEEQLISLDKRLRTSEESLRKLGEGKTNIRLAEPMQQKLVDLEFELAELLQRYTERHPKVVQIRDQIRSMETQAEGSSEQQLEYSRLSREVEVNKKLYGILKEKLEEARITEAQKVSDVSIVDPAVMPGPLGQVNNSIKILIGALLGLFLGIGLAFILETLDTSIGTIEDVENVIKLPVLGVVPSFESESGAERQLLKQIKESIFPSRRTEAEEESFRLIAHFQPHSPITESYRNIHTNLKLGPQKKTVMVTSSSPREGKSSVACNLAIVMGQVGLKTLLVSTDLRRPVLAKTFGIKGEPGLNELMMGTATLDEVLNNVTDMFLGKLNFEEVRKTPGIENVWILPSGHLPDNPVELLESTKMDNLIAMLKAQFDIIIFDAPPVLPVTDASLMAPKMDCTVLVYEIGRTSREALLRTKIQLESAGAKISGIVLNHTRAQTEAIADYPYNYRYRKYKYYTKIDPEKGQKNKKNGDKV